MSNLKKKMKKQEGFTLIEMLIVVAIIAILIAISIPLVGNALDRARHATDQANERAAKAEITLQYLAGADAKVYAVDGAETKGALSNTTVYFYDATNGRLCSGLPTVKYSQCTKHGHGDANTQVLAMKISADGVVEMQWTADGNITTIKSNVCTGQTLS